MKKPAKKRVSSADIDYPGDGCYYHKGKRFTGVEYTLNEDKGWVESETEYLGGLPSGWSREWAGPKRNRLVYEGQFRGGMVHGRQRRWESDGTLVEEGEYEYGIPLWEKKWDEDGKLIDDYKLKETDKNYTLLVKYRQIEKDQDDERKSIAEAFLRLLKQNQGSAYRIVEWGMSPDARCVDDAGKELNLEIVPISNHEKSSVEALAEAADALRDKLVGPYDPGTALVVGATSPLDGEEWTPLLPQLRALFQKDQRVFERGIWILNHQKTKLFRVF